MMIIMKKRKRVRIGILQKQILLIFATWIALSRTNTLGKQYKVIQELCKELREVEKQSVQRSLDSLSRSKLILEKRLKNGEVVSVFSDKGKKYARYFQLDDIRIKKPKRWDGKWRVVMYDVPDKLKKVRESLRYHLKELGFVEIQKSVFAHPFECEEEIKHIAEFYNSKKYIRFMLVESIDGEDKLRKCFGV